MKINECGCGCGGNTEMCSNYKESRLNYMFLGNLETIKRMIDEMVQMDANQVDEILKGGHDWAVDHIASSVDDIQEVYNFLKNRVSVSTDKKMDPFAEGDIFIKTFESYVNELSRGTYYNAADLAASRKRSKLSDRFIEHGKEHGLDEKVIYLAVGNDGNDEAELHGAKVIKNGSNIEIRAFSRDGARITISVIIPSSNNRPVTFYWNQNTYAMAKTRRDANNLRKLLIDAEVNDAADAVYLNSDSSDFNDYKS
jgi:hypothetical protein